MAALEQRSPAARDATAPAPVRARSARDGVRAQRALILPAAALLAICIGGALWIGHDRDVAHRLWLGALVVTGLPVFVRTLRDVLRGAFATDVVAALAVATAVALGEPLAGLIVVLMQTGGEALERYAEGRASDAVRALEEQAPRIAHRLADGAVHDITVDAIAVGDLLLVRPGEFIPSDADVVDGRSTIDTSRLTGESVPLDAAPGTHLLSGMMNGDGALTVRATARSSESQYARIVELVRSAEASKSPLQRLADRYAGWFTPLTLAVCALTWFVTRDLDRVLAVLVVATPCPLILATPIAIIGGINRAATRHVIVRSGTALERLASAHIAVFDKTGTLTEGRPRVRAVHVLDGFDRGRLLRLAGGIEQGAGHLLARSLAEMAAHEVGMLPSPSDVVETPGRGVEGVVEGHRVRVGARSYVAEGATLPAELPLLEGTALRALVAVDGALAAVVEYEDAVRAGAAPLLRRLTALGFRRTILLSGDHAPNARAVADAVGIAEAAGELLPGDKVARVASLSETEGGVMMVGDGTNDAPALSRADVGIALASHGGGITAEAADVVVLIDDLERVGDAIVIARRTLHIARQSIGVGLALSAIGMVVAAVGYLPPVAGAVAQEVIDVAVILNALRARRGGGGG